jgi:tetratricopeptide (TPR) repeat protein
MRSLVAALLFAVTAYGSAGGGWRQRSARPPINTQRPLDVLGLSQPESVRSILLLYTGKSILRTKANELEAELKQSPGRIDDRLLLIGYYTWNAHDGLDKLRLRAHVLWMIGNHPEHPATAEPSLRDLPDDPEGNNQVLQLWQHHLESTRDDVAILKNAEKFLFGKDPAAADRLIHLIAEKEPSNPQWASELAQLYRMFGIPGQSFETPTERALEEYNRVLALTHDPAARRSLSGDMADAAFKIGDFPAAAELARIYLKSSDRPAVQRANTILGRVALRSGDITNAKQYLLNSVDSGAARDIAFSGPILILAKELFDRGEHEAVMQYLENCLALWPRGEPILRMWIGEIQAGKTPNFGN